MPPLSPPKEIIVSLFNESSEHLCKIDHLEEMVQLLKNEIFGRKSEKRSVVDSRQFLLFDETRDDSPEAEVQSPDRQQVAGHTRKKPVRKPLPADLPRVEIVHDIDEAEKSCPCGCQLIPKSFATSRRAAGAAGTGVRISSEPFGTDPARISERIPRLCAMRCL
jgi:hypothetical protein